MAVAIALGVCEAAESLDLSRRTLYELIRVRELRVIKVGRRTLVPRVELERFVARKLREAA